MGGAFVVATRPLLVPSPLVVVKPDLPLPFGATSLSNHFRLPPRPGPDQESDTDVGGRARRTRVDEAGGFYLPLSTGDRGCTSGDGAPFLPPVLLPTRG